jgi:hypothetical protein
MTVIRRNPETIARRAAEAAQSEVEAIRDARRAAFTAEADPLFFKVARGEAPQADYDAKVAEVRARLPYPPAL